MAGRARWQASSEPRLRPAAEFTRHAGPESLTLATTEALTAQTPPATTALADRPEYSGQPSLAANRYERRPTPSVFGRQHQWLCMDDNELPCLPVAWLEPKEACEA